MASADGESICETCREIDFHHLLHHARYDHPRFASLYPSIAQNVRYSPDCKLCSLIFSGTPLDHLGKMFELGSFFSAAATGIVRSTIELRIFLPNRIGRFTSPSGAVFCRLASDVSQSLGCVQPVHRIWDCDKVRSWLDTCARCHGTACKSDSLRVPGMNLIDCANMVIVKAAQETPWLALSYVWGVEHQKRDLERYRAGSRLSMRIPNTIRDAIIVTLRLGYRFLWVDEYCIDQNDEIHRSEQISRMDQIYQGADLTIVAAAGTNKMYGLPGVGSTKRTEGNVVYIGDVIVFANRIMPHTETTRSKWFTRAW